MDRAIVAWIQSNKKKWIFIKEQRKKNQSSNFTTYFSAVAN
jgi:hypothetical protein